ncbi:MAG: hypothetical protein KBA07_05020 [Petrotogaceae bacterium]|mgnify:FL=1|nr:hypothetical protein [Petrotogaceae bacterium]
MQIFFLPQWLTIFLCFILWPVIQISIAVLCTKIPQSKFSYSSGIFKPHRWEKNGSIYQTLFKVKKWKKFLPDGGAVMKNGYRKKRLRNYSVIELEKFLAESCRAELVHLLAILPFWIFGFFAPIEILVYMFIYAVSVNFPCIIVQRYNRPRILHLMEKIKLNLSDCDKIL